MPTKHGNSDLMGLERLVFFSDAVFAIAIALLLLLPSRKVKGGGAVGKTSHLSRLFR